MLGAGAIGSVLGSFLYKAGIDVTLVDVNKAHIEAIQKNGLHVTDGAKGTTEVFNIKAVSDPAAAGAQDMVICLLGPYMKSALASSKALFNDDTIVCSFQNGLGNELDLQDCGFPKDRIAYGCLHFSGHMQGPGETKGMFSDPGTKIHIGVLTFGGRAEAVAKEFAETVNNSGFATEFNVDINNYIWGKAVANVPCNGLCGILRLRIGEMYETEWGRDIMHGTLKEMCEVAKAMGVDLDYEKNLKNFEEVTFQVAKGHYPSLAQSVQNHKQTEIETLNGAIVRFGEMYGIPTPYNKVIANLVRVIQLNYDRMF